MFICIVFLIVFSNTCVPSVYACTQAANFYINLLKKITYYYESHGNETNIAVMFGLFVTNVNLKHTLHSYTTNIVAAMNDIIKRNEKIIKTFNENPNKTLSTPYLEIATLFNDTSLWVKHLIQFSSDRWLTGLLDKSIKESPIWSKYVLVQKLQKGKPNQYSSNTCLVSLTMYKTNTKDETVRCPLEKPCKVALTNGTNFGYSLTHRILWLVLARYGRWCYILSDEEDEDLMRNLCDKAASEIEDHLYYYNYLDLLLEFMCVCSLAGYQQFVLSNYLYPLEHRMKNLGCISPYRVQWFPDMGCSNHITALAACSLSNGLRQACDPVNNVYG